MRWRVCFDITEITTMSTAILCCEKIILVDSLVLSQSNNWTHKSDHLSNMYNSPTITIFYKSTSKL